MAEGPMIPLLSQVGSRVIVPMTHLHLRRVAAIEAEVNSHPWPLSLFRSELSMPTSRHWLVALADREVLGYAGIMWTLDEAHVTNFAVHPEHRRDQIATGLLLAQFRDAIELGVADISLEVRMSNEAAQALYRGFGFAPGGVRPRYYNDNGEDALIMWATDIGSDTSLRRLESIEASLRSPLVRGGR